MHFLLREYFALWKILGILAPVVGVVYLWHKWRGHDDLGPRTFYSLMKLMFIWVPALFGVIGLLKDEDTTGSLLGLASAVFFFFLFRIVEREPATPDD
jgi:drug/metabolite transporter (DMT)-like permease